MKTVQMPKSQKSNFLRKLTAYSVLALIYGTTIIIQSAITLHIKDLVNFENFRDPLLSFVYIYIYILINIR